MTRFQYVNGNYLVYGNTFCLYKRAFRVGEDLTSNFPDSIDLKVTNKCFWGCPFCHESSTKDGESFDIEKTKNILDQLPNVPIEIAIGGGNIFEETEKVLELVSWLKNKNMQPRITINSRDIISRKGKFSTLEKELIESVEVWGISIQSFSQYQDVKKFMDRSPFGCVYKVFHVISGIFPPKDLYKLYEKGNRSPVLVLGYKQWGRAKDTKLPDSLQEFENVTKKIILEERNNWDHSRFCISFDNLAIEQLHIKDCLHKEDWDRLYMGDEGSHSMYIDAVSGVYSRTSRSAERKSWNDIGLLEFFKSL